MEVVKLELQAAAAVSRKLPSKRHIMAIGFCFMNSTDMTEAKQDHVADV